ncbi:hypothetical protein DCC85_09660 [Paenibacillus sp. CAA11]|uniref:permease n=1 Tax=Paenibacillus sp. CAA11 TaxID=1532905 RepID=UPI000D3BF5E3|nr:permease [Paenibacillus sp. CAA11]AWB44465.1 hypothetical protein DCC85_09660 [Paenibacillus sp. CAA11]
MRYARSIKILTLAAPAAFLLVWIILFLPQSVSLLHSSYAAVFKIHFLGILLEAVPFVLLGSLLSSFIHLILPENLLGRWMPKNPILGVGLACLLGVIFPVCECGMIPLIRRLIQKGTPAYIAIVFLLSGPIVNPVVFSATLLALRGHSELVYARLGLAALVSAVIGLILYRTIRGNPLKHTVSSAANHEHTGLRRGRIASFFQHASDDFFEAGKYLIAGCLITAVIQTFTSHSALTSLGEGPLGAYPFMMGLGFVLSLCSTSDAFVAATFLHTFSPGPILAFLVMGPMLDFKNLLMLLSVFRTKLVVQLSLLIISLVLIGSVLTEQWLLPH